jgi:hypothetical protein
VDTHYGPWTHVDDGEPLWREPMIHSLLDRSRPTPLFVQGMAANQGRFYHRFDAIVLFTAPIEVITDRLHTRTNNPFGKTEAERRQIANVEPLLRQAATHEIDTNRPLTEVVDTLMDIAQQPTC